MMSKTWLNYFSFIGAALTNLICHRQGSRSWTVYVTNENDTWMRVRTGKHGYTNNRYYIGYCVLLLTSYVDHHKLQRWGDHFSLVNETRLEYFLAFFIFVQKHQENNNSANGSPRLCQFITGFRVVSISIYSP